MIRWIEKTALLLLHERSIMRHGGSRGMRDEGLLDSALARPQNIMAYIDSPTLSQLAAAYAFGIAKNHPFLDGNKRAAFAAMGLFLKLNGWNLTANKVDATLVMLRVAASEITEEQLTHWIDANIAPRDVPK